MKKTLAVILALLVVMMASSVLAADITVSVYGENVEFDQAPEIIDGVLMLPFRYVVEKMGAKVNWNEETRTVFAELNGSFLTLQIGNETVFLGSEAVEIDKAPVIVNSRTLVPTAIIETLSQASVEWNEAELSATITK